MNDYQLEKLYINTFAVIAFAIVAAIQFAILYKFGLKGGIVFALAFSILFSFGSQVFLAWAKGMGDSRGIGTSSQIRVFSPQLLICLGLFTVYSFGMYFYAEYLKTGLLNKPLFFSWLAIFVGGPVLFYGQAALRFYIAESGQRNNYVKARIQISHYNELPIFIEPLKITNTINRKESAIFITNQSSYHSEELLKQVNVWDKITMRNQAEEVESNFPINSDKLTISWYSPVEGTYYTDTIDFPFNEFKLNKYPDEITSLNLRMEILPGGKLYIYTTKENGRHAYHIKAREINEKDKAEFIKLIHQYNVNIEQKIFTDNLYMEENRRRLQSRINQEESLFQLSFHIIGPGQLKSIDFEDRRYWGYDCTYKNLNTSSLKPIPENITLYFTDTGKESFLRTYLFFDKENLHKTIQRLTDGKKDMPIEIFISIKDSNKENIEVLIRGNNQSMVFSDWKANIVKGD